MIGWLKRWFCTLTMVSVLGTVTYAQLVLFPNDTVGAIHIEHLFGKHLFAGLESGFYFRVTDYALYPLVKHGVIDNHINHGWLF